MSGGCSPQVEGQLTLGGAQACPAMHGRDSVIKASTQTVGGVSCATSPGPTRPFPSQSPCLRGDVGASSCTGTADPREADDMAAGEGWVLAA